MASIPRVGPLVLPRTHGSKTLVCRRQRQFSSSTIRKSARTPRIDLSKFAPQQKNTATRMKGLSRSEIPDDIGLIPQTFVRPTWSEGPSLFSSQWKQRLMMDYLYAKQTAKDTLGMLYFRYLTRKKHPRETKVPLSKKERLGVAQSLHTTLYQAIAEADKTALEKIALSGLAQQQLGRIDKRRLADLPTKESWSCVYKGLGAGRLPWLLQVFLPFKSVKIVADRSLELPFGSGSTIQMRQFVARVRTRQTRNKTDGSAPVTKDLTEYMVVQRLAVDGKPEEWKVWGTTKPSTYHDALEIENPMGEEKQKSGAIVDGLRRRLEGMTT